MLSVREGEPVGVFGGIERHEHAVVRIVLDGGDSQRREAVQIVRRVDRHGLGHHSALNSSNGSPQAAHV